MKTFRELENRLQNLLAVLDGDFWRKLLQETDPPKHLPPEQATLDMVFRDTKAFSGYIPDLMTMMRLHIPDELSAEEIQSITSILGTIQLMTRILLMILLVPRYHDHEDLITTFNGYRQTLVFVEDFLDKANKKNQTRPDPTVQKPEPGNY